MFGAVSTKLWEQTETGQNEGMRGGDVIIAGEVFETGHVLIGATPTKILFNLAKTGTPSGIAELKLINSSNVEKATFGTIDMDELDDTFATKTFENSTNTATIADGDRIAWYYSGDESFQLQLCSSCAESYTHGSYYISSWVPRLTRLFTMEVWGY